MQIKCILFVVCKCGRIRGMAASEGSRIYHSGTISYVQNLKGHADQDTHYLLRDVGNQYILNVRRK